MVQRIFHHYLSLLASWTIRIAVIGMVSLSAQPFVQAGSISGEVKFTGPPPGLPSVRVTKDQDYCGQALPNEAYVVGPGGGLKNVVISIEGSPSHLGPSERENILDNNGCRFVPRVMAMMRGEKLIIHNSDPKLHIVHSYLDKRTVFNLSLPFRGQRIEITQKIRKPGLLQVNCDTHGWMRGYIHVFDHPFFAVSDERGIFLISNIPAGKYSLKAWHEEAGVRSNEVMVAEEGEIRVQFEFGNR